MRRKELCILLTFSTTTEAMAMEAHASAHGLPGRLIPVPTVIHAGCGVCWKAPIAEKPRILAAMEKEQLPYEGFFELVI
ncbi:MAG: DUF3343 domain-containing protein [Oscillospiraceae bacterium]|jgi:hypothetical protein|nr:DUF3343 domain-containing protein [Oscillospiraceae bacterium]